jgi:pyridoxal biosynthesis lyase PdxS
MAVEFQIRNPLSRSTEAYQEHRDKGKRRGIVEAVRHMRTIVREMKQHTVLRGDVLIEMSKDLPNCSR